MSKASLKNEAVSDLDRITILGTEVRPYSLEDLQSLSESDRIARYEAISRAIERTVGKLKTSSTRRLSPAEAKRMARLVVERRKLNMVADPDGVGNDDVRYAY